MFSKRRWRYEYENKESGKVLLERFSVTISFDMILRAKQQNKISYENSNKNGRRNLDEKTEEYLKDPNLFYFKCFLNRSPINRKWIAF